MELKEWEIEKPRLLFALGKMESWSSLLLQSVQETRQMVEKANDDFMFKPESHPVGVASFEMEMRGIDSALREILAVHQAIQEHYRENQAPLNTGKLLEKKDFTNDEIAEVLQLVQKSSEAGEGNDMAPVVVHVTKDKIVFHIEENK